MMWLIIHSGGGTIGIVPPWAGKFLFSPLPGRVGNVNLIILGVGVAYSSVPAPSGRGSEFTQHLPPSFTEDYKSAHNVNFPTLR